MSKGTPLPQDLKVLEQNLIGGCQLTRKPMNKCRKHGAKPNKNNLSFEKIKLDFETFWNFERIITMCKILGTYKFPKVRQ